MIVKILFMSILFYLNVYASTEKGNGGDAIVCRDSDGNITRAELFDYYEGTLIYKQEPNLESEYSGNYQNMVYGALRRLQKVDYILFSKYFERSRSIVGEMSFIPNIVLEDIKDTGTIYIPTGCKIEQVAIRRKAEIVKPGEKRFIVSKDIWDKFSEQDRAGLILHELIYEHYSPDYGIPDQDIPVVVQNNSIKVRHFNYMLSTPGFKSWSTAEYVYFIKRLAVQLWYIGYYRVFNNLIEQVAFDLTYNILFHENGVVAEGVLAKEYSPHSEWSFTIAPKSYIKLYPTGTIQEIRGGYLTKLLTNDGIYELCGFISIPTLYTESGALKQATLCRNKMPFKAYFKGKVIMSEGLEPYLFGAIEFGVSMQTASLGVAIDRNMKIEAEDGQMLELSCTSEEKINGYCAYQVYLGKNKKAGKIEKRIYTPTIN